MSCQGEGDSPESANWGPPMIKEPFTIEAEQEADGRWVAEVLEIPWILAYAETREEAITRVRDLAMRTLAEDGEI